MPRLLTFLLAGCLLAACAEPATDAPAEPPAAEAPAPETSDGAPSLPLAEILEAARSGDDAALLKRLAPPARVEATPTENRHTPGQMDTVRTYHYDGLTITAYHVAGGGTLIQQVEVTGGDYRTAGGLGPGSSRADVEAALGPPPVCEGDVYEYDLGEVTPHPLRITFAGDAVASLRWGFYVD